jgi:hypothetical protein
MARKEGHIYMIKEREFINADQNVFKIGRSTNVTVRLMKYPKDSQPILMMKCSDIIACEKQVIRSFKDKFTHRTDVGTEYFEGDESEMMRELITIVSSYRADSKETADEQTSDEENMDPAFNDDVSTLDLIVDPTITVCRGINVIDIFTSVPDLNSLVVIDAIHEKLPDLTNIIRKTIEEYYEIVPGAFTSCNMFEMHLCRVHKLDYYAHFAEIVSAVISDMTNYTLSTAGAPQTISVLSESFRVIPGLRPKKIIHPTFKFGTMFDFATEYGCAIDRNGIVDGVNSIKDPINDREQFDLMAEVMGRIPLIINDVPGMVINASDLAIKLTSMTSKRVSMGECIALCYWMGAPIEIIEGSPDALIHICVDFNTKTWHQIDLAENPSSC